ncbi:hypothetical protein BJ546DRAFT_949759 [Cryomyces antarcticus]
MQLFTPPLCKAIIEVLYRQLVIFPGAQGSIGRGFLFPSVALSPSPGTSTLTSGTARIRLPACMKSNDIGQAAEVAKEAGSDFQGEAVLVKSFRVLVSGILSSSLHLTIVYHPNIGLIESPSSGSQSVVLTHEFVSLLGADRRPYVAAGHALDDTSSAVAAFPKFGVSSHLSRTVLRFLAARDLQLSSYRLAQVHPASGGRSNSSLRILPVDFHVHGLNTIEIDGRRQSYPPSGQSPSLSNVCVKSRNKFSMTDVTLRRVAAMSDVSLHRLQVTGRGSRGTSAKTTTASGGSSASSTRLSLLLLPLAIV